MGLFDDLGKDMKKVELEIHKTDLDKQIKDLEQGIHMAGHEISAGIKKAQDSASGENTAP
ncbi:MAG: hypothetical protein PHT99_01745 [Methanoregula sp.]|nr:hypothetical protein [Methanoregula sp.]